VFVAFDEEVWVWLAVLGGEGGSVDEVAEVGGEGCLLAVVGGGFCWG